MRVIPFILYFLIIAFSDRYLNKWKRKHSENTNLECFFVVGTGI